MIVTSANTACRRCARRDRGFSLIELAIILGVTAIIGALGVSAYRTHVVRAQISDSIARAAAVQQSVATSFKANGEPPADRTAAGLPTAASADGGDFHDSIDVFAGRVEIRFGGAADPAIADLTVSLTPFETVAQEIVWVCGNKIPGPGLRPLGFAAGGRQSVQVLTTIDPRYLPATCR